MSSSFRSANDIEARLCSNSVQWSTRILARNKFYFVDIFHSTFFYCLQYGTDDAFVYIPVQ